MAHIADELRKAVVSRANGQCEYCQTQQTIVIYMEIDHIIPEAAGGLTTAENLCLACASCNRFKQGALAGTDPLTGEEAPLFNPRRQRWVDHFAWQAQGTRLVGLTPTGRATVERLKMNTPLIVSARRRWVEAGWHPPK